MKQTDIEHNRLKHLKNSLKHLTETPFVMASGGGKLIICGKERNGKW